MEENDDEFGAGEDRIVSFFSPIDESCVDYVGEDGNLELYFDQKLYEPPQALVDFEKKLYE